MPTSDRLNISSRSRASASSSVCCDFRREMSVSTATTSCSPAAGSARRTDSEYQAGGAAPPAGDREFGLEALSRACSCRQRLREAAEQLADGGAGSGAGVAARACDSKRRLQRTSIVAAQVGDAGGGALEDGGQLAQQLLALALRAFLLGHVERDHGAPAGVALARLDARQQPAPAELGMVDRVAHLGALAAAQRLLQPSRTRAATPARRCRARSTAAPPTWPARAGARRAGAASRARCRRWPRRRRRCPSARRSPAAPGRAPPRRCGPRPRP